MNYSDLLRSEGWRICVVIAVSTLMVLAATSLVVDRLYRFELRARVSRAIVTDFIISLLCLALTLLVYYLNKRLYRRRPTLLLMPLVLTPLVLVALLLLTHVSWQDYIAESHWLLWLLGPATLALRCRFTKTCTLSVATGCR